MGHRSSHLDELRRQLQRILEVEFPGEIEPEAAP